MKINKIHIPKDYAKEVELKEIDLTSRDLGRVIALCGKNGAGKSRILKFVENYPDYLTIENFLDDHIDYDGDNRNLNIQIQNNKQNIDVFKNGGLTKSQAIQQKSNWTAQILTPLAAELRKNTKYLTNTALTEIKRGLHTKFHLENLLKSPFPQNQSEVNELSVVNSETTINYLHTISEDVLLEGYNLMLEGKDQGKIEESESFQRFDSIRFFIKKFLNKTLSYKGVNAVRNEPLKSSLFLDGNPFSIDLLSPGEKTLFAYAILLFILDKASSSKFSNSIIIIDEPELHLHPEAQIKLIKSLKEIVEDKGQLWIATHSIHILAHLNYDQIYMIKENEIIRPSRFTPGKSLNELMGLDSHLEKVQNFMSSMSDWAYANFVEQCFEKPEVIFKSSKNDIQVKELIKAIESKTQISLLDFGAGKGRIGTIISEHKTLSSKIKYYAALEPNSELHKELELVPNLNSIYKENKELTEDEFDVVLICNVLHEISPEFWLESFEAIHKSLKKNGVLIIIEDKLMPKGERANDYGFILMNEKPLSKLFNDNPISFTYPVSEFDEKRILCAIVPKSSIDVKKENILNSLKTTESETLVSIKKFKKENNVANGRIYGLTLQSHINAKLGYEKLKKTLNDSPYLKKSI